MCCCDQTHANSHYRLHETTWPAVCVYIWHLPPASSERMFWCVGWSLCWADMSCTFILKWSENSHFLVNLQSYAHTSIWFPQVCWLTVIRDCSLFFLKPSALYCFSFRWSWEIWLWIYGGPCISTVIQELQENNYYERQFPPKIQRIMCFPKSGSQ